MDPSGIPHFRTVKEHDEQDLLDHVAESVALHGWKPGPISAEDGASFINKEVVACLYGLLADTIATLRFDELLTWLIAHNEAAVAHLFGTRLTIPTRLACFHDQANLVDALKKELPDINKAAVATRFLIEYSTAQPSQGIRPMSMEVYDRLVALSSSMVTWGYDSDHIKYGIADTTLSVLPSGRVGVARDEFLRAQASFLAEHTVEEVYGARRSFARDVAVPVPPPDRDHPKNPELAGTLEEIDEASLAEFGVTFTEIGHLVGDLYSMGEEQPGSAKMLPRPTLIQRLSSTLGWPKKKVSETLDLFSLSPRPEFLVPPQPYSRNDVYPWRFNRELSYLRRPLLRTGSGPRERVIWGNRNLHQFHRYLFDQIMGGKIFARSERMRNLVGRFNRERGEEFNDSIADLFQERSDLIVRRRVKKVGGKRIRGKMGDLGDIDVLVIDSKSRKVLVIECKDLAMARTPYELSRELDSVFKGTTEEKSTVEKHRLRAEWVNSNLPAVLREFGITPTRGWETEIVLAVDGPLYSSHLVKGQIRIASHRQLVEDVLPTWDRTKEWRFS